MLKRILSLLVTLAVVCSINIIPVLAETTDAETTRLSVRYGSSGYSINNSTCDSVTMTSSGIVSKATYKSNVSAYNYTITFSEPLTLNDKKLLIRYKYKYTTTSGGKVDYVCLRFYGTAGKTTYVGEPGPSTEKMISAKNQGVDCEGSFYLNATTASSSGRAFDVGDSLTSIIVNFKCLENKTSFENTFEYLEIVQLNNEKEYSAFRPIDQNVNVIGNHESPAAGSVNYQIANANPGQTIVIPDNTYSNVTIKVPSGVSGTKENPITIKAETPGGVIIKGKSSISVEGKYVILDGLYLTEGLGTLGSTTTHAVEFTASSSDCIMRNCAIINYNGVNSQTENFTDMEPAPTLTYDWIHISGNNTVIENCYFSEKYGTGVLLTVSPGYQTDDDGNKIEGTDFGRNVIIRNNYIGYYQASSYYTYENGTQKLNSSQNGSETIRIGLSHTSLEDANCLVTGNFFEQCNGENELISNKSSSNTFSYNTLYNSKGALCLRHGDNCIVKGNLFIGDAKAGSGTRGLRIIGKKQKVFDNYFISMAPDGNALAIESGNPNAGVKEYPEYLDLYSPVEDMDMHNNTFINCGVSIDIGSSHGGASTAPNGDELYRTVSPEGKIYNNLIQTNLALQHSNITYYLVNKNNSCSINNLEITNNQYRSNRATSAKTIDTELSGNAGFIKKTEDFLKTFDEYYYSNDGVGADLNEVRKAPYTPLEIMPEWVKTIHNNGSIDLPFVKLDTLVFTDITEHTDAACVLAIGSEYLFVNGERFSFDEDDSLVSPYKDNNKIMVPLRFIAEKMGGEVEWNSLTGTATIRNIRLYKELKKSSVVTDYVLTHKASSDEITVSEDSHSNKDATSTTIKLNDKTEVRNGRVYISLKDFAEALNMRIYYHYNDSLDIELIALAPALDVIREMQGEDGKINEYALNFLGDITGLTASYQFVDSVGATDANDEENIVISWNPVYDVDSYKLTIKNQAGYILHVQSDLLTSTYTYNFAPVVSQNDTSLIYEVQMQKDSSFSAPVVGSLDISFGGGTGEEGNPYKIYSKRHYMNLVNNNEALKELHFKQCADIYTNITEPIPALRGSYIGDLSDGSTHRVLTVNINKSGVWGTAGMIENGSGVELRNIRLKGSVTLTGPTGYANIRENSTYTYAALGGLIAAAGGNSDYAVTIDNCINEADIYLYSSGTTLGSLYNSSYKSYGVGGIIGSSYGLTTINITDCINVGSINTVSSRVGGIHGHATVTKIENCANFAYIQGSSSVGGISGDLTGGNILKCSNGGEVYATSDGAGGIIGAATAGSPIVSECYNDGLIRNGASNYVGGIIGKSHSSGGHIQIANCINKGNVTSSSSSAKKGSMTGGMSRPSSTTDTTKRLSIYNTISFINMQPVSNNLSSPLGAYYNEEGDSTKAATNYYLSPSLATGRGGIATSNAGLKTIISIDSSFDTSVWGSDSSGYPKLKNAPDLDALNTLYGFGL